MVDVFTPWICCIHLSRDSRHMQPPSLEPESGVMGTEMEYFVKSVQVAHSRLKGTCTRTYTHTCTCTLYMYMYMSRYMHAYAHTNTNT